MHFGICNSNYTYGFMTILHHALEFIVGELCMLAYEQPFMQMIPCSFFILLWQS